MAQSGLSRPLRPLDIRQGDTVLVLTGKDAGKRGVVEHIVRNPVSFEVAPARAGASARQRAGGTMRTASKRGDAVVVQGINMVKRHTKPRPRQGRTERTPRIQQGGIIEKPMPMQVSNVMVICPECNQPTRIRHGRVGKDSVRLCSRCGSPVTKATKA